METNLKEANRKLGILEKNGIRVEKKMICLGSKFSFDFTQIQRLNGWYQNEIERLEKEKEDTKNDSAQIIYNQIRWGNDKDKVLKFIKEVWKVYDTPEPTRSRC